MLRKISKIGTKYVTSTPPWNTIPNMFRHKKTILSILADAPSSTLDPFDQTNLNHLRSFYASCLDEDLLDSEGSKPILDVVKGVLGAWRDRTSKRRLEEGGFRVQVVHDGGDMEDLIKKASKRDRLTSTLSYLHARGKFNVLCFSFSWYVSHFRP